MSPRRTRPARAAPSLGPEGGPAARAGRDHAQDRDLVRQAVGVAHGAGNRALARALKRPSGAPLDRAAASRHAATLGRPLDGVRVADDATAHAAARSVGATAFTVGRTIYVGRDAPPPGTAGGQRLLAHELAHVLQQEDAGRVRAAAVSVPGEPHERAADRAAAGHGGNAVASGAPPGVQREPADPASAVDPQTKAPPAMVSRPELTELLTGYFEQLLAQQGGKSVRITDDVKFALRRAFVGDPMGEIALMGYLGGTSFPSMPAALAAEVAKRMPDPIARARVAHLAAGPAAPDSKGKIARVTDLVVSTAPSISPEQQQSQWAFDQAAKDLRRGENAIGPFGLDLQRATAVGAGLPKALKGPGATAAAARSYPAVDAAVTSVAAGALTPAEVAGTPAADEYADAQLVARTLARDLDVAQQKKQGTVALRLGANYLKAKDRDAIIAAVERIVVLVRDALPHHASAVEAVELYFGEFRMRRVPLAAKGE